MLKKPIQFGKYYLLDRVNVGGMAEVFKAKSVGVEGFERLLAVKRILPNIAEDQEFITMFIDEAKIAVQLNHANIAQIFDLGKVDDAYFIALEYVHGKDLRALFDRCKQRPEAGALTMPIAQACFVVMKVCEGLDYAHNKRDASGNELHLVHRDVSPQNVLISYEGEVKLIDFGIAKAAGKVSKTQAGILKGKFGYMSPEQVRGLPLDRRSDIFAVGICLYEILTGERLFVGESDFSTLEKVRNVEILPPSAYNRKIPEELERIVLKALAKDVEDRYQNPIDLHDDLQAFMYTSGEFYSRKDLAAWMKRVWAQEIQSEGARIEEYRSLPAILDAEPAKPAAAQKDSAQKPAGSSKKGGGKSSGAPGARSSAGLEEAVARKSSKEMPLAAGGFTAEATQEVADGDLSWDDEEIETHVYDLPSDAGDAIESESSVDDDDDDQPLPSVDDMDLSDDGAPVPAKSAAPAPVAVVAAKPAKNGAAGASTAAKLTPVGIPVASHSGEEPTAVGPLPNEREAAELLSGKGGDGDITDAGKPLSSDFKTTAGKPSAKAREGAGAEGPGPKLVVTMPPGAKALLASAVGGSAEGADDVGFPELAGISPSMESATPVLTGSHAIYVPPPAKPKNNALVGGVAAALAVVLAAGGWLVFLRPTTGELQLVAEPSDGARILVDNQPVSMAEAAHLRRPSGPYTVSIEKDGYQPWTERIDLKVGDAVSRRVMLVPLARAGFTMVSDPAGATVTLDGKPLGGVTPFKVEGISPGQHQVEVRAQDKVWMQSVNLEPGKILDLHALLQAPGAAAPPVAAPAPTVAAAPPPTAAPAPAAAPTPVAAPAPAPAPAPAASPEPKHETAKPKPAAKPAPASEPVAASDDNAGKQRRLPRPPPVAPEPAPKPAPAPKVVEKSEPAGGGGEGFLRLGSKPWTNITIDGKDNGHTPQLHLKLSVGKHKVTLANPQFGINDSFTVEIKQGLTETVVKDLRPKGADDGAE